MPTPGRPHRLASCLLRAGFVLPAAAVCLASVGCRPDSPAGGAPVAVASTYLESAVHDVLGVDTAVLRLAEPGTCPGHFDVRAGQIEALRACRLLLRFDFQGAWDGKLARLTSGGLAIASVAPGAGLCTPQAYLTTCRQVADALIEAGLTSRAVADERLAALEARLEADATWARSVIAGVSLAGAEVIASAHQAEFCRFLGLNVTATFAGMDTARIGELDAALGAGRRARMVIANRPEGHGLADAIAARLGVPVVVFDNFPGAAGDDGAFSALVRGNVQRLVAAARP